MLIARGHRPIGSADLRWALLFGPHVWSVAVERRGLVLDTRFIPAAPDPARSRSCLYFLLSGTWEVHRGERFVGPCAFVVSEAHIEGAGGRRELTFAARGEPFRAVEIHVRNADLSVARERPVRVDVDDGLLTAASQVADLARSDDATLERLFGELLGQLARRESLVASVAAAALRPPAKPLERLWTALRPMVERMYLNPTLQEVGDASGVSMRQLDRYVEQFVGSFGLVGARWRASTLHLRLKLAVMLLSADGASVADVAHAVGYGSSDALGRTFRDAGLPAPAAVQQAVRASRAEV